MASIYATAVISVQDPSDPSTLMYVADGFQSIAHATLMIDPSKPRCLVYSPVDGVIGTNVFTLFTAANVGEIRTAARTQSPTAQERNRINQWLIDGGFSELTPDDISWLDVFHRAARQVNPGMHLDNVFAI